MKISENNIEQSYECLNIEDVIPDIETYTPEYNSLATYIDQKITLFSCNISENSRLKDKECVLLVFEDCKNRMHEIMTSARKIVKQCEQIRKACPDFGKEDCKCVLPCMIKGKLSMGKWSGFYLWKVNRDKDNENGEE